MMLNVIASEIEDICVKCNIARQSLIILIRNDVYDDIMLRSPYRSIIGFDETCSRRTICGVRMQVDLGLDRAFRVIPTINKEIPV